MTDPVSAADTIAIGCFASLCRDRLADRLLAFSRAAPGVALGIHELTLTELLPAVRAGQVAVAIAPECAAIDGDLASLPLWREEVRIALASGHALAAAPSLTPAALFDTVVLGPAERPAADMLRFVLARLFADRLPPISARPGGEEAVLARVAAGEGVALVLAGHAVPPGVATRPVAAAGASFAIRALWRRDRRDPATVDLLQLLGDR